jgi:hypothetical protein
VPDATETSPLNLMKLYRLIWRGSSRPPPPVKVVPGKL